MIEPLFILDSGEAWAPVAVEACATVRADLVGLDRKRAPLREGSDWLARLPAGGGALDFSGNMVQPPKEPRVGYYRAVDFAGLTWHQYWLFYLYNPKSYAGVGAHEGDWEFVQIGSTRGAMGQPVLVTGSQHHSGEKREYWRCELRRGRPVVYVARGSHANYFAPTDDLTDTADGMGEELQIEWRSFGPWATWKGRWGHSTGEGMSPASPGRQGVRWAAPHVYHGQARAG